MQIFRKQFYDSGHASSLQVSKDEKKKKKNLPQNFIAVANFFFFFFQNSELNLSI